MVGDLGRAEGFYSGVLGLPVVARHADDEGTPRAVWVDLGGGAFLAIELAAAEGPRRVDEAPGHHCVALAIARSEREVWAAKLESAGFPVVRRTPYTLYVRDPDGNLVGLSHHPEAA